MIVALCAALVLVAAAALRVASAQSGGLWLDEIWSLQLAEGLSSVLDVLTIRQDNNHPLNTLVLWLLSDGRDPSDFATFRAPAVVAGVLATAVAGLLGRAKDGIFALTAMIAVGLSSLLVHYSSEARGYSFAVLFALTSLLASSRKGAVWCVAFNASVVLGMLSHLSFAHVYGAIALWWVWERRGRLREARIELLRWHALPVVTSAALYFLQARDLPVAGGPDAELGWMFGRTASMAVGFAGYGTGRWIGSAIALAIASASIVWLWRRGDDRWLLYAAGIFALPLVTLMLGRPEFLAPRYFLMSVLLFLLLAAESSAALFRRGGAARVLAIAAIAGFVVGNGLTMKGLLQHGRGEYWQALAYMANRSEKVIQVGSDHDVRVGVVLGYYERGLRDGRQLAYHRQGQWPPTGPLWLVKHKHGRLYPVEKEIAVRGNSYRLERVFPTGPLSGSHWLVYRNANAVKAD